MFPHINVAHCGFPLLYFSTIMQYSSFCHFNAFFLFPLFWFLCDNYFPSTNFRKQLPDIFVAITISPQPISQNNCLTFSFGFFAITISPQPISQNNCLTNFFWFLCDNYFPSTNLRQQLPDMFFITAMLETLTNLARNPH